MWDVPHHVPSRWREEGTVDPELPLTHSGVLPGYLAWSELINVLGIISSSTLVVPTTVLGDRLRASAAAGR